MGDTQTITFGDHRAVLRTDDPYRTFGSMAIIGYPNGYGASIVSHLSSYGGRDGLWEVAVLRLADGTDTADPAWWRDYAAWTLCYDTPITDDVVGRLTVDEAAEILDRIRDLPGEGS